MRENWRTLASLMEGSRRQVAASIAVSIVQSALLVPIAFLIRHAFDETIPDHDSSGLLVIGGLTMGLFVLSSILGVLNRWFSLRATKQAIRRLLTRLLTKVFALPVSYYDRADLGALHAVIVQDSERLDQMVTALVSTVIPATVIGVVLCATLLVLNPLLGAVLFCSIPLLILVGRKLSPKVRGLTREWQRASETFSSETQVALRSVTLTKLHGAERTELERRMPHLAKLAEAGTRMSAWHGAYSAQQQLISATVAIAVLVVGGISVIEGNSSLGDLISFYAVLALLRNQVLTGTMSMPQVLSGMESLVRLREILEEPAEDPYSGSRPIDFRGGVELNGVSFEYTPGRPVLRDVSLRVEPGEIVALLGPNGAGKSTIISLIAGLYRPGSGSIAADGVPLEELDLTRLRRSMGVVVQDPLILPDTIRANIAFGRPEATHEEIEGAAIRAGAHEFIEELSDGYDARTGDDGVLLSGGQRQRLATARALLGNPVLLMLDEPTTHLDREATGELIDELMRQPGGPAILVVSHDPAVAETADRLYWLQDGRLDESGRVPAPAVDE
jgi:ABC-type bacteriocin/lantibiotic exporter with double-glycine peptidase domain